MKLTDVLQLRDANISIQEVHFYNDGNLQSVSFFYPLAAEPITVKEKELTPDVNAEMLDEMYEQGRNSILELLNEEQKIKLRKYEENKLLTWSS